MTIDATSKSYRDGDASSTALLDQAMHESGAAYQGEKLDWHHDPESLDNARKDARDEPIEMAHKAAEKLAELVKDKAIGAAAKKIGGEEFAQVVEFARDPTSLLKKPVQDRIMKTLTKAAGALGVAESGMIVAGVATVAAAVRNIQLAEKLRASSDVVAMDLAATSLLDLNVDYQVSVYRQYDGSIAPDSVMNKFKNPDGSLTAYGKENLPKLQAACDAGRSAALKAVYCDDVKGFLDANPKIKERIAKDIAFSKGWDEVMYVKNQPGAAGKLEDIEHRVKARDAWSTASAIPVRA